MYFNPLQPYVAFLYPLKTYQITFRFSDVFRGYRKATPGCNGLKYKDHPSIKLIRKNTSFVNLFTFSEITETHIEREILKLNSKKAGTFGNVPAKILKESFDDRNLAFKNIWNFEMLEKLADVTLVYKKKDPYLVGNCRLVSALPSVSKLFERIFRKQISCHTSYF